MIVQEFHFHVYYQPEQRIEAERFRREICRIGGSEWMVSTLSDGPRGPHVKPRSCDLVVIRRTDDASAEESLIASGRKILNSLNAMHSISLQKDGIDLPEFGTKIYFVEESVSDAQSTIIREQIETQGSFRAQFITDDVASYIQNRKLYSR